MVQNLGEFFVHIAVTYGGPQLSRQKEITSRQKEKPHGKRNNFTAKVKDSWQKKKDKKSHSEVTVRLFFLP